MREPRKIPVLSLKGGTGKTTICLGIARALRDNGKRVGILDIDIHASALPRALHLEADPGYDPLVGGKLRPITYDGFQIFSTGLLFPEDTPNMWDGRMKADAVRQIATTTIAWAPDLSVIVVDTPPTSGDEVQSLLEHMTNILGCVIVCQPNDLAVLGIAKTLNVLRETETPIAGLVANMAGYRCPHCSQVSNPFDRDPDDVKDLAKQFKVHYLGAVPFGPEQDRVTPLKEITDRILTWKPVILKEKKGGLTRWALDRFLK